MTIRVLIADDHPVFRHGLRAALADAANVTVVGEATDGDAAVAAAVELAADVVLMDLNMPGRNGIDATRALAQTAPRVAVLCQRAEEAGRSPALRGHADLVVANAGVATYGPFREMDLATIDRIAQTWSVSHGTLLRPMPFSTALKTPNSLL